MPSQHPSQPIPSGTIIIGREAAQDFEVFMVVRHQQIDFASGALVFPGGKADEGDHDPGFRKRCINADGLDETELALRVTAIRETYEESGLLLAKPENENSLISGTRLKTLSNYRKKLIDNDILFLDFLERESLVLAIDMLTLFAHWITPELMPKRFDTFFFLAEAPKDQIGVHDGTESVDSVWISPRQALAENEDGKRTIIFPTRMNIQKLGRSASMSEAIETARRSRVMTVQPWIENREDGAYLCIPEEADYGLTAESLDKIIGEQKTR